MRTQCEKPAGIVQEDFVEQKQPNLMQALKATPELHLVWREQVDLVGKGTHEKAKPRCV